jgi:hypothetical protein
MSPNLSPELWSEEDRNAWLTFAVSNVGRKLFEQLCLALPASSNGSDPARSLGIIEGHRSAIALLKRLTQSDTPIDKKPEFYADLDNDALWKHVKIDSL